MGSQMSIVHNVQVHRIGGSAAQKCLMLLHPTDISPELKQTICHADLAPPPHTGPATYDMRSLILYMHVKYR